MKLPFNWKSTRKDDLAGGLLAAIIGLPMGLAFGVQSGLGAQAGLFTAIALPIIAAFFGGTKTLISDPTGPMTVVAAAVVSMSITQTGALDNAWTLIVATFLLAGVFQLVFGIIDFGRYVKYLPYPVLSGFMAGIGFIIISVQLFPIFGYESPTGFLTILTTLDEPLSNINKSAFALGILTIAIIYLLPLLTKKIPAILFALIVGTIVSAVFQLDVPTIGNIPRELPPFRLDALSSLHYSDLELIIGPALIIGSLGVIDTLLTSVVADNITRTRHNSRWTIIGQGVGNIFISFFGALPGAGATMGTVTNIRSGAKTTLSGGLKGAILLFIVATTADLVQYIPMSVLAGILITIGIGIIDYKGVRLLLKVPRQDTAVWFIVLLVTLFDNLLNAVGIGIVLSAVFFIGKMSNMVGRMMRSTTLENTTHRQKVPAEIANKIHVKQLEGPLFFGFANAFREQCQRIDNVLAVIVHLKYVPFLDQSGIVTLESIITDWHNRGIQVYLAGGNKIVMESMEKVNLIPDLVKRTDCFDHFEDCMDAIVERYKNGVLQS